MSKTQLQTISIPFLIDPQSFNWRRRSSSYMAFEQRAMSKRFLCCLGSSCPGFGCILLEFGIGDWELKTMYTSIRFWTRR